MQEIKYHPVQINDDEPIVQEYSSYQNGLMHYLEECRKHWILKFLLICLVIVKAIYLINNFEHLDEKDINDNQTDIFFQSNTILFGTTSEKTLKKEKYSLVKALQLNNFDTFTSAINSAVNVTAANPNNYENNNKNINITTPNMIKESINDAKAITISFNKMAIEKLTTEIYVNKRLLQTTDINGDLQKTGIKITTPTTTTKPVTAAGAAKTFVVKSSSPHEKKYFINTSQCHIPFVEPFTPEINKIFKPQRYTGCTKDQPIVTSSFNELESHYILHINYTVAESLRKSTRKSKKAKSIKEDLLCCYQQIVRSGSGSNADASFKLLPCTNFHQNFVVPSHVNGILISCKLKSKKSTVQKDALSFIQINKTESPQKARDTKIEQRKPSFLLIGIDTLSRINFRRNMPETFKYLIDNKFYELLGYNKVGDNTLPNLMPLLSGYTKATVYEKCHPQKSGGFDSCNFIWTTFKNNGYHTAYAEDTSAMSTFNYMLKGFNKPPTDYYFRPIGLAMEKSLKRKTKAGLNYCVGRKQLGEYIFDYATEFAKRFNHSSSFGFFWTNSFSHNSFDVSATMDKTIHKYFKEWKNLGILENSVVIFFSDHGARWGPLLKLSQGFLEERLPMFFISVPNWFRQAHPQLVNNLEINQKRLSNPFDIHMTFQHLLKLSEPNYKIQQTLDCPKCQSIFVELPENRTCDDANIPEAWCTCLPFETQSTKSQVVQTVAKLIVQEINHYYELKNLTSLCTALQLKQITNAKMRYREETNSLSNITTYAIDFTTKPITNPKTLFSATVDYEAHTKRIHLNVEDISRQSLYENTAKCTDDKQAKKYCICKNSFK